jgi:hypothetical protein
MPELPALVETQLREQSLLLGPLAQAPLVPEMVLAEAREQAEREPEPQQGQVQEAYIVLVAKERAR